MREEPQILVIGAGGHAKVVIATLQAAGRTACAVLDDDPGHLGASILGVPVVGSLASAVEFSGAEAIVAIGDNRIRCDIVKRLSLRWATVIHPSAVVHPSVQLGPGTVVFAGAVVQPDVRVGGHAIVNTSATVDHDCTVGDFVHLAPGAHLGGGISVGDGSFLGVGSVVLPNLTIGDWAVLGGGAVAIRDLQAGAVAVGVPARPLQSAPGRPAGRFHASSVATLIAPHDPRWRAALGRAAHDFYHFPEYASLCANYDKARPLAFYAELDGHVCLIPLLLRGLREDLRTSSALCDLVSPYGYASPIFSCPDRPEYIAAFLRAFRRISDEVGACSVALRLHPLIQHNLSDSVPLSKVVQHGETVVSDLRESEEEMMRHTRDGHRSDISRLQRLNFAPAIDDWSFYGEFARVYRDTMARLGASPYYLFDDSYFDGLRSALGESLHLCCVLSPEGSVAAGGLFTGVNGIIQYHLSGTDPQYHKLGPTKLMLHCMRLWGKRRGYSMLHLGGGAGAQTSSLFQFKAGFSSLRRPFQTYRLIPNESRYAALTLRVGRGLDLEADLGAVFFPPHLQNVRIFRSRRVMTRILLSIPHMGGAEQSHVREAFTTNWLSTVGPNLTAFEREFEARIGLPVVALSSGTAALHLALRLVGVGPGDEVFCSTLTFAAAANAILYQGGVPVFVDSDRATWNLDADLLSCALRERAAANRLPKALVVVHLYGQSADMDPILHACAEYGIAVVEDAAEAVGTRYKGKPAGTLGDVGVYSFNGNKIVTTTGGGLLISRSQAWADKARFWSQQARDPGIAYEHSELGYNYRMSNVLAGIGRGQLEVLDLRVQQRRAIAFRYRDAFADLPGISLMPQAPYGLHTNWLSCFLIEEEKFGCSRDRLIRALDEANVESRPVWKPMHLQPLYAGCECYGGDVAADLFRRGICLPSSSSLSVQDQMHVVNAVRHAAGRNGLDELNEPETGQRYRVATVGD